MKKKWMRLCALLLSMLMVFSCIACGSKENDSESSETVESEIAESETKEPEGQEADETSEMSGRLTFCMWAEEQRGIMEETIALFNESYPDVTVELIVIPWEQYWMKMQTSLGDSNGPDVFWLNVDHVNEYAPKGLVEPLDSYIEADGMDMGIFAESVQGMYNVNGVQYGMPKDYDTIGLFYNKQIFDEKGVAYPTDDWTWEDLEAACEALSGDGIHAISVDLINLQCWLDNFVATNGGTLVSEDGTTFQFDSPEVIEAIEWSMDLVEAGYSPDYYSLQENGSDNRFMGGLTAMQVVGDWCIATYQEALGEDNIGVVEIPTKVGEGNVIHGLGVCMNSASENKELAWEFMKMFTTEDVGKVQSSSVIPALSSAADYWTDGFGDMDVSCFLRSVEFATPVYSVTVEYSAQSEVVSSYLAKIAGGEMAIEDAVAAIDEECAEIVQNASK